MGETPPKREWKRLEGPPEETPIERDFREGRRFNYQPPERVPENPDIPKPLNPGKIDKMHIKEQNLAERFPELTWVIATMDKIEAEEFPVSGTFNAPYADYITIARLTKEALLMRAIVEDWNDKTLFEEYREEMARMRVLCKDESWLDEAKTRIHGFWQGMTESTDKKRPGSKGFNAKLEDRMWGFSPSRIAQAKTETLKLSQMYKRVELTGTYKYTPLPDVVMDAADKIGVVDKYDIDYCLGLDDDGACDDWEDAEDLNPDRLDYVINVAIPFYLDYITNKGIVENWTLKDIKNACRENFNRLYKSCET